MHGTDMTTPMVMLSKFRTWSAASGRVIAGPAKSCIDPNDSGSNK